jgi:hypothetical protein
MSSRNALKRGVFTNALMPGEDPEAVEVIVDDVIDRFELRDATGEICARRFVQTTLQIKRLNDAQLAYVEGFMQSEEVKSEFCRQVGITPMRAHELPSWYFSQNEERRTRARFICEVVEDATDLLKNYSVDKMTRAKSLYPHLWRAVMGPEGSATEKVHTLGERIGTTYKKATPHENLQVYINELEEKFVWMLFWARDEDRCESIVNGLRAKATLDAASNANWVRADGLFHRRSQDLMQTMVSLRLDAQRIDGSSAKLELIEPKPKKTKRLQATQKRSKTQKSEQAA